MNEEISLIDIQRKIRKPFGKEQVQQWMAPSEGRVWVDLIVDWLIIAARLHLFCFFPNVVERSHRIRDDRMFPIPVIYSRPTMDFTVIFPEIEPAIIS
jgi:hypothetical protein